MAIEFRGGGAFYYRKRREGDRVVSEYVGGGLVGLIVAQDDEGDRAAGPSTTRGTRPTIPGREPGACVRVLLIGKVEDIGLSCGRGGPTGADDRVHGGESDG